MRHFASPAFWDGYARLPDSIRALADQNYAMLKNNPRTSVAAVEESRPLLVRSRGNRHRALAVEIEGSLLWFGSDRTRTMTPSSDDEWR